jgi:hypothetical protein
MRDLVRSSVTTGIAVAAVGALAVTPATLPAEVHSPPTVATNVRLAAATTATTATPPLGALIGQFITNQGQNCELVCPFIVQLAVQPAVNFAIIPFTFAQELQSPGTLLQAIARTDATVSGALNDAVTGIINNDLNGPLPRAQNALEVALVGLIDIGITGVTQPGGILTAINTARTDFFGALQQPPGTMGPPVVHNALEAGVVRAIEVTSALTFQAPERLLLGVTQAAHALFSTLGNTGDVGAALRAVGASIATTVTESLAFIPRALNVPIQISPAVATAAPAITAAPATAAALATAAKTTASPQKTPATKPLAIATQQQRANVDEEENGTSVKEPSEVTKTKPAATTSTSSTTHDQTPTAKPLAGATHDGRATVDGTDHDVSTKGTSAADDTKTSGPSGSSGSKPKAEKESHRSAGTPGAHEDHRSKKSGK